MEALLCCLAMAAMLTFCWPPEVALDLLPMPAMLPKEKRSSKLAELEVVEAAGLVGLVEGVANEDELEMGGREVVDDGDMGEV